MTEIMSTTSLPVDCLTATDCNIAAYARRDKNGENVVDVTLLPVNAKTSNDNNTSTCVMIPYRLYAINVHVLSRLTVQNLNLITAWDVPFL